MNLWRKKTEVHPIIFHPDVFDRWVRATQCERILLTSKKLYRATTRPDDIGRLVVIRPGFPQFDPSRKVMTADLWSATLYDAWVTAKGENSDKAWLLINPSG